MSVNYGELIPGVQNQINRIRDAIADSYTAVSEKGGTLPSVETVDNLPAAIRSIEAGVKPTIIVTAEAGSTLTCGSQSYTLGAAETTHTFTVAAFGTYIVTATKGSDSATETVLVDVATEYTVELKYATNVAVTITGSGDVNWCYATVGGTKRYGPGTYTVQTGDTITFHVGGQAGHVGTVKIDGTEVLRNGSINGADYDWDVPRNTSTIRISISYSRSYYQGTITVTTT